MVRPLSAHLAGGGDADEDGERWRLRAVFLGGAAVGDRAGEAIGLSGADGRPAVADLGFLTPTAAPPLSLHSSSDSPISITSAMPA